MSEGISPVSGGEAPCVCLGTLPMLFRHSRQLRSSASPKTPFPLTKSLLLYVSGRRALLYRASPGSIPGRSTKFSFWLGGQFDDRCYDPDTDNLADFKSAAQCGADRFPRSLDRQSVV